MIETRVEHRVTIHGGDDIDHDAELSRAILEATKVALKRKSLRGS